MAKEKTPLCMYMYSVLCLGGVFITAVGLLYLQASYLSSILDASKHSVYIPTSLEELKEVAGSLGKLKDDHFGIVWVFFCSAYVFKQSFAIPGSALLNVLAGALFGTVKGVLLVSLLTPIGASCCYLLSKFILKDVVEHYFSEQLNLVQQKISDESKSLLLVMISLRLVPATPNWMLNIIAPILVVPLPLFFISVSLGLLPYNYICIQAGTLLAELNSMSDLITMATFMKLLSISLLIALPSYFVRRWTRPGRNMKH